MLDPRIYRMSLVLPVLALLVLAFSLTSQPGARQASLAPVALQGTNIAGTMQSLQARFSARAPGSVADARMAATVQRSLGSSQSGFQTTTDTFVGTTTHGERPLTNVVATHPGTASDLGSIVVVAPRTARGTAGTSATAMLLELGRVLGGETLQRTVVLASVDGDQGARRLVETMSEPIDAVIVLGDVAAAQVRTPVVLPWSGRDAVAPPGLRNTLAAAFTAQTGLRAGAPAILSQLAHLAFPLTVSAQAPFADRGIPAVELSLSGDGAASASAPVAGAGRLGNVGRAVLSTVTALDDSGPIAAPSAYVIVAGQVVPSWAIGLFVLALILPVLLTTLDGLARARRRRYPVGRAVGVVLAAGAPFLVAGIVVVVGGAIDALPASPDALAPGVIPVSGGAIAVMSVAVLAALACAVAVRPLVAAITTAREGPAPTSHRARTARAASADAVWGATAGATLLVMTVVALLLWVGDPFAAALLVPALHLSLWALDRDLPLRGAARGAMLLLGVVPVIGLVLFDAHALSFSAPAAAWEAVLLLAGHAVSWSAAILWSLALGCLLSALVLVLARARAPEPVASTVSVRGPASYAGPGSLGGTKSALRR